MLVHSGHISLVYNEHWMATVDQLCPLWTSIHSVVTVYVSRPVVKMLLNKCITTKFEEHTSQ